MQSLKNDRLLKAIWRQPVDATPIWVMRQAGRYLPEYRAIRQKAGSFLKLCKTPELACEVTLQPLARFPLDAAILFSDILTIPDAMGLGLYFKEGEGPGFERPLTNEREIDALGIPDPEVDLRYVLDAVRLIKRELAGNVPLIGFCGSPWTVSTYMVEGSANKSFPAIRQMMRQQPHILHHLLDKMAQAITLHLNAQIKAGVDVVMIFDTWGGMLTTEQYQEYSLNYVRQIIAHLIKEQQGQKIPAILFTKGGGQWLELMTGVECDVIGVDSSVNLGVARKEVSGRVAIQGNMDPAILYRTPDEIRAEVTRLLAEFGSGSGHVFNLGHGIPQDVAPENVAVLVDAVHTESQRYHTGSI